MSDDESDLMTNWGGEYEAAPHVTVDPDTLVAQVEESRRDTEPGREYEVVAAVVTRGLAGVRQRIALLRTEREQINDEIRRLVAEEAQLTRMARIAETPDTKKRRTRLSG